MRIRELQIQGFGKFQDKMIRFEPGLNLIEGRNESGKSTVHAFIRAMFFGLERRRGRVGKEDKYQKYMPWGLQTAYGGSMDFELDGKNYRILRDFHKNQKSVSCICLDTGREVVLPGGQITDLIPGFTEALYCNTVSLEQKKAQTDEELAAQVRNYIANMALAGNGEVDMKQAMQRLQEKKKQLEQEQKEYAEAIHRVTQEIAAKRETEARIARLTTRQQELTNERAELACRLSAFEQEITKRYGTALTELPLIRERYLTAEKLKNQIVEEGQKEAELRQKAEQAEKERAVIEKRDKSLRKLEELKETRREAELRKRELMSKQQAEENLRQDNYRQRSAVVVGTGLIITILCLLLQNISGSYFGIYGGIILMLAGAALYLITEKKTRKRRIPYEEEIAELEQEILRSESRRHEILLENNVLDERDLRIRQETGIRSFHSPEQLSELAAWHARQREEMQQRCLKEQQFIMTYAKRFLPLSQEEPDEAYIRSLEERVGACAKDCARQKADLQSRSGEYDLELGRLKWELERMQGYDEKLAMCETELQRLEACRKTGQEELHALQLAIGTIEELSANLHDSFGGRFGKEISETVCRYTRNRHEKTWIDERLNIRVGEENAFVPLERLSIGTIDQIYLALRLAAAGHLTGRCDLPLLLDDTFAYYDDERLKTVLKELSDKGCQILLFTCQKREGEVLTELAQEHHTVTL